MAADLLIAATILFGIPLALRARWQPTRGQALGACLLLFLVDAGLFGFLGQPVREPTLLVAAALAYPVLRWPR